MINKVFRKMLATQIFTQIAITICMLVDSIMIGQFLGVDAMAAYGFSNPILLVFTAIGGLVAAGVQVVCSSYLGKGDSNSINRVFTSCTTVLFTISIVGLALIFIFLNPLVSILGADSGTVVFDLTKDYLMGFALGLPFFIGSLLMLPFIQMNGKQNVVLAAVIALTIGDIVLDFLNANCALFGGGIFGMGLASSVSYFLSFVVALFMFFLRKDCPYKFSLKTFKAKYFGEVCRGGIPTTVNQISIVLLTLLVNNLLANIDGGGTIAVAAHSVIITVANLCYSFGTGVGAANLMVSGIYYNEEDRAGIISTIKMSLKYSFIINAIVVAIVFIFAGGVINMFLSASSGNGSAQSADTISLATNGIRIFIFSLLPCCITAIYKAYCQGTDKIRFSAILSGLQNFIFPGICASILCATSLGAYGIWLGYVCGELLTLIAFYVIVCLKNKKVSMSINAVSMLPDSFGVSENNYMEIRVTDKAGAIEASKAANAFCLSHGSDSKTAMHFALCVEEMAMNILKHGFADGKNNSIEMKFIYKEDSFILRIRDNCKNFDPIKYFELNDESDPAAHIGIRMMIKLSSDANYISSLGLNNLTIRV